MNVTAFGAVYVESSGIVFEANPADIDVLVGDNGAASRIVQF